MSNANEVTILNSDLLCCDGIAKIENKSSSYMARARVYFNNGEELSVIYGDGSYGYEDGLFEIMCNEKFYDDYDPDDEYQDSVRGNLTVADVQLYIRKIAAA